MSRPSDRPPSRRANDQRVGVVASLGGGRAAEQTILQA